MWHEVAKLEDIARGGMKYVRAGDDDREICLCEYDGVYLRGEPPLRPRERAAQRGRPGGLDHHLPASRRPVRHPQRHNLSWPLDHDMGPEEDIPEPVKRWFKLQKRLEWKTRVHDLHTYEVRVRDGAIEVDV